MADHGLTYADADDLIVGERLHFTNHPCRRSVPVTYVGPRGLVRFDDGTELHAFADELSREPREGLGL